MGKKPIHDLLCRCRVVADRMVDDEVDGKRLADVLPADERVGDERVLRDLDLMPDTTPILMVDIHLVGPVRGAEAPTGLRGAGTRHHLSNSIDGDGLWI